MFAQPGVCYSDTCAALDRRIREYDARIRVSEQNAKLRDSQQEQLDKFEKSLNAINYMIDYLKPIVVDLEQYIGEKKKESLQNINNAIRLSGEIIKDATEGIHFEIDGDEAWLATPDELEVDLVEGGGFRQISSNFIRTVVLDSNLNTLNTLMLDEVFALVSPENSAVLSLYLNVMCQNMQIISIEQKPQVYSNIDCTMYKFVKGDPYASVTKEEIKRSDMSDLQTKGDV